MSRTRRLLAAGSAAVVLALGASVVTEALPLPGVAGQERPADASAMGWGAGMPAMRGSADLMFAVHMAEHHESAVQMARLAEQRAQRPEVRALARDIARSQTAEIAQLRAAAARLDTGSAAGSPDRTGMGMGMGGGWAPT